MGINKLIEQGNNDILDSLKIEQKMFEEPYMHLFNEKRNIEDTLAACIASFYSFKKALSMDPKNQEAQNGFSYCMAKIKLYYEIMGMDGVCDAFISRYNRDLNPELKEKFKEQYQILKENSPFHLKS